MAEVTGAAIVNPPVFTPAQFGLLSVASFPTLGDERWPLGVMFEEHGAARAFSADGWCRPALASIHDNAGTEQVETVTLTGPPTAGTFTLTDPGTGATTAPIAFDAAAADVQTAVRVLRVYQDATVTGNAGGPYTITLPAEQGPQPALTADSSGLTGGAAEVAVTTEGVAPGFSTDDQGVPYGQSAAVTVYALFDCSPVGRDVEAARALAKMKLDYAAPRALERAIWTGKDSAAAAITGQALASTDTDDLSGGAAADLVTALGQLEAWLGDNYAGQGVVHSPRTAGPTFDRFRQVSTVSGHKETGLGTRVAFGQGYDGSGPDGAAAAAGQAWLYATPAVMVLQGGDVINPDPQHALDRANNRLIMAAERQYLVAWETGAAAVLATLGA